MNGVTKEWRKEQKEGMKRREGKGQTIASLL